MFLHLSVILSTEGCVSQHALGQAPPLGRNPPGQTPWGDTPVQTPPGQTPRADTPQQTATAADSTHPTGMHTCFHLRLNQSSENSKNSSFQSFWSM